MIFIEDPKTEVFVNEGGGITISQPGVCQDCGEGHSHFLTFSSHRARLVAAGLIWFADEIESKGNGEKVSNV